MSDRWERRALCGDGPGERAGVNNRWQTWSPLDTPCGDAEEKSRRDKQRLRTSKAQSARICSPRPCPRASSTTARPLVLFTPQAVHRRDRDRSGSQMLGAAKGEEINGRRGAWGYANYGENMRREGLAQSLY